MKKFLLSLLVSLFASSAHAGGTATFVPANPYFMPAGIILMTTPGGAIAGAPACATQQGFAIDASTPAGKVQLSAVLTAYAMGRQIAVYGTGACIVWGDRETVNYLQIVG
jgi:hypothetical protein